MKDDTLEETGWKLVHGDVFRPPQRTKLLAALIGSGIQILCVSFVVIGEDFCGLLLAGILISLCYTVEP